LKASGKAFETLVEVAGVEPASRNTSRSASTCVVCLLILARWRKKHLSDRDYLQPFSLR